MFPVPLNIQQFQRHEPQPLRFGIPFAPGQCQQPADFSLWQDNQPLPQHLQVSSHWPDGSVRWLLADTLVRQANTLELRQQNLTAALDTGQWQLQAQTEQLQLKQASLSAFPLQLRLVLHHQGEQFAQFSAPEVCVRTAFFDEYRITARFAGLPLHAELRLCCYAEGLVQCSVLLHNPQRARHTGGLWDLGDAGSVLFQGLELDIQWLDGQDQLWPEADSETQPLPAQWRLEQLGSGGTHWQSENHVAADGTVNVTQPGYQLLTNTLTPQTGRRASPQLRRHTSDATLCLTPCEFWQNFPSSLSAHGNSLRLGLFAPGQQYELQGGERKTQQCWLRLSKNPAATLSFPLQPALVNADVAYYQAAGAMPWLNDAAPQDYDQLLQPSLDSQRGFAAKREVIDEFGWRHFGDIFADHESLYLPPLSKPYISHYNNQYDPIYGFCRQYLRSGDARWFSLMDELARHVSDIDIYHTDEDRAEYNHGLFWHTDHYLPAHTCTHRTYSKHNSTSSIPGQTGGGPANEHCYSTGLLYHYWLTGNRHSKQAVLDLADWMVNLHEGAPGLLSRLWSVKLRELPKFKALLRGGTASPYRYPFTRGTGNYLNTLLDAYELTAAPHYLQRAEQVLQDCLHPNDDIHKRDLENIEVTWSYLVLLGTLPRYLRLKTIINQQDTVFQHMAAALHRYCCWIAEHEQPFLTKPEVLEFPNETWTAQDMRKVMLLRQAAQLFPADAQLFLAPAERWFQWLQQRLQASKELEFARVQVLLLLVHGAQQPDTLVRALPAVPACNEPAPRLSWGPLLWRVTKTIARGVLEFRPARERQWLKNRMSS